MHKIDPTLLDLSQKAFIDERSAVKALFADAEWFAPAETIEKKAAHYIEILRKEKTIGHMDAFQHEYNLSSHEGIMIMCLAEALLRIPDAATADALIHDKLSSADWDKHLGLGHGLLVNASALGFELAGKVSDSAGNFIAGLIHRLGEPVVRAALKSAMKLMGNNFVLAETIEAAKTKAESWHKKGYAFSFDMLGEGARSNAQAEQYFAQYLRAIKSLGQQEGSLYTRDGISVKLSALHPRVELRRLESLERELLPRLKVLVHEAMQQGIMLTIDAEEATRFDVNFILFEKVFSDPEFAGYLGLGLAVQAYQKRAYYFIDALQSLAKKYKKRIPVRLVKGAYWDSEIKRAQVDGLENYPVFTRKAHTDISYLACARKLLKHPELFYPQFATHNARTVASIVHMGAGNEYEFQRLHGMGEALYDVVLKDTPRSCRIYAPVGAPQHLLSYLIRRILENGANSSFVRGLYSAPISELIADPCAQTDFSSAIVLPEDIYGTRKNSRGIDFGNAAHLKSLYRNLQIKGEVARPADASLKDCDGAFSRATAAFDTWRYVPVDARAEMLERIADIYEEHGTELLALLMQEAQKTIADAISELRESIDYCRYYAIEARRIYKAQMLTGPSGESNTLSLLPRGIMVAISPWNFPLAIFTGQILSALVTGNVVLAKPAEETPAIASRAVALMHKGGIPKDVLQLLCGSGEVIGAKLVSDTRTAAVVFTGGTEAAQSINRTLAGRDGAIVPLIAETGGQNCMVVDSSALIEQTVDDIIVSAFGSAGQRCSSLRVVFVQEDIADDLLAVLKGAMERLRMGVPNDFATDIGPVISNEAHKKLITHIAVMKKTAKLIAHAKAPEEGLFVAPHAFEISSIGILTSEVFGPVLHVVRYNAGTLDAVIAQINSTGYGLTFGIQSRIDERIHYLSSRVRAGNIYVNRAMTGAVVGVQPFGGMGLSGTGPKAGGPHYLVRFCTEQAISVNIAAIGGNIELLTR